MQNGLARFEGDEEIDESGFYGNTGFFGGGGIKEFRFTTNSSSMREAQYIGKIQMPAFIFMTNVFSVELC